MTQNVCFERLFGQNKVSGLDAIAKSLQTTIFCIKTSQEHIYGQWIVYEILGLLFWTHVLSNSLE